MTAREPRTDELAVFVLEALEFGWPDNTIAREDDEFPGFWNTHYERDQWRYVDLWSGSSTDAGVQFVFWEQRPVWTCVYRGGLLFEEDMVDLSVERNEVFACLVEALSLDGPAQLPIRGPERYADGHLEYTFRPTGDLHSFLAVEAIERDNECVYERLLVGGQFGDGVAYGGSIGSLIR